MTDSKICLHFVPHPQQIGTPSSGRNVTKEQSRRQRSIGFQYIGLDLL